MNLLQLFGPGVRGSWPPLSKPILRYWLRSICRRSSIVGKLLNPCDRMTWNLQTKAITNSWMARPDDKICMMMTRLACNRAIESSYWRMDNNLDVGLLMGYVLTGYRLNWNPWIWIPFTVDSDCTLLCAQVDRTRYSSIASGNNCIVQLCKCVSLHL
jgi:hypothetical protein